jgi:hypothetical protein
MKVLDKEEKKIYNTFMKLTKDRFSCWENVEDEDYEQKFDDELIIDVKEGETNRDIADYILGMQDKIIKLEKRIKQLESYHKAVPLSCEHSKLCMCFNDISQDDVDMPKGDES